uniref:NADH-ubiquinone oxidoreductase chain 3 n=1 Tax=Sinanodonta woodiana TaxID=1069815 RepID=A0A346HGX3_SINWO|nr:NADH dehydrogenase subunit 3 [Sinanodonta woodiana]AXO78659.1 NADH dehydrogenase subunit 3 [Sinanodonta woodiana]
MAILFYFVCSSVISLVIIVLGLMLSSRSNVISELSSPFECGFDPVSNSRVGFSLRFFFVLILFIIFDFETVLLIPSAMWLKEGMLNNWSLFCFVSFLVMLLLGICYELKEGVLQWKV